MWFLSHSVDFFAKIRVLSHSDDVFAENLVFFPIPAILFAENLVLSRSGDFFAENDSANQFECGLECVRTGH